MKRRGTDESTPGNVTQVDRRTFMGSAIGAAAGLTAAALSTATGAAEAPPLSVIQQGAQQATARRARARRSCSARSSTSTTAKSRARSRAT